MRLIILIASFLALAASKPEMYKEKEDFQYSRSSSDDGSRSGYYGAQRGNMGGNYEKAHNMDGLAQHQMSTLVRQVDGELGAGANTRTGSVFSAANSRGYYGSGNYDLSNLNGRNFAEGTSVDDSSLHASRFQNSGYSGYSDYKNIHSGVNNARYSSSHSRTSSLNSGHQTSDLSSQYQQTDDQITERDTYGTRNYEYGNRGESNYKYNAQSGSKAHTEYDYRNENLNSANDYDYNTRSKFLQTAPVRLYLRPGTRAAVPVAVQTYDESQKASVQGQNAVRTDAEILRNSGQQAFNKPTNNARHYESSFSYRKEWEKHDKTPVTLNPTEYPSSRNNELYEDTRLSQAAANQYKLESTNDQTSNSANSAYLSGHRANTKSGTSSQSEYNAQTHSSAASATSSDHNAYKIDASANLFGSHTSDSAASSNNLIEDIGSRPKSYHSSYSYHKSWERRGDPYVIKPASGNVMEQTSQRLTAAGTNQGYSSQQYECNYCIDDNQQRIRRSLNTEDQQSNDRWENFANLGQATQNNWDDLGIVNQQSQSPLGYQQSLGQEIQNQWDNIEDLGQQTQNQWGNLANLGQQAQNEWSKIEDLGQQSQNHWDNLGTLNQEPQNQLANQESLDQQTKNQQENIEDFGQQTQNQWNKLESLGHETQNEWSKIENLGQVSQSQWDNLDSLGQTTQNQWDKPNDLGQEIRSKWDKTGDLSQSSQIRDELEHLGQQTQNQQENIEDLGQQTQNQWDKLGNLGQETQNEWSKIDDLGQVSQNQWDKLDNLGQTTQNQWDNIHDLGQEIQSQSQIQGELEHLGQQTQNQWDKLENLGQQAENQLGKVEDSGQQAQNQWDKLDNLGQETQNEWSQLDDLGQVSQNQWDKLGNLGQKTQNEWSKIDDLSQVSQNQWDKLDNLGQTTQNQWDNPHDLGQEIQSQSQIQGELEHLGQQTENQWDKLENLGKQAENQLGKVEDSGQQAQNQWDKLDNLGQTTQNQWDNPHDLGQEIQSHLQIQGELEHLGQQTQNQWNKLENLGQQEDNQLGTIEDSGQQAQHQWGKLEDLDQQAQNEFSKLGDLGQQTENHWNKLHNLSQTTINQWDNSGESKQISKIQDEQKNLGQKVYNKWDIPADFNTNSKVKSDLEDLGQQSENQWGKLENLGQQTLTQWDKSDLGQETLTHWGKQEQQMQNKWSNLNQGRNMEQGVELGNVAKHFEDQKTDIGDKNKKSSLNNFNINEQTDSSQGMNTTSKAQEESTSDVVMHPIDLGRGDIPEISDEKKAYKSLDLIGKHTSQNKSQFSEEPLILNIMGLNQQNGIIGKEKNNKLSTGIVSVTTTTKPKTEMKIISNNQEFPPITIPVQHHTVQKLDQAELNHEQELEFIKVQNTAQYITPYEEQQSQQPEDFQNHLDEERKSFAQPHQFKQENAQLLNLDEPLSQSSQNWYNDIEDHLQVSHVESTPDVTQSYQPRLYRVMSDSYQNQQNENLHEHNYGKSNKDPFNDNLNKKNEQSFSKNNDEEIPIEITTEKSGFWGSMWQKTKSAKDSVVSWFRS